MASSPTSNLQLTQWGLPPLIISWFRKKGISSLFPWQVECLFKDNVLNGDNLVYSAPTSAGKTLVADILLLKRVLEDNKKALVIEPFVALTREKAATLKSMLFTTKARVGAFGGTYYTPGGMAAVTIAVCTIEKANNFVNKLINENKLADLGIIVVDEIHYLGDEHRGYQLELLLTKVLFYNSLQDKNKRIQIVGLSATIPNLGFIAKWLKASLYVTEYRPVPLAEKIKISKNIYDVKSFIQDSNCKPIEIIDPQKIVVENDHDDLFYLCIDSITNGHSALIFCESKRDCEISAKNLATQIRLVANQLNSTNAAHATVAKTIRDNISAIKLKDVYDKLKKCPAGPDQDLALSVYRAVAFHHAGLTSEEREIIEDGFKSGAIKILFATSTLSSGVNLPARRVIIKSPTMFTSDGGHYQRQMLKPATYRQMIGRAGRKNIDTSGESVLICTPENKNIAIQLIKASVGEISSSLGYRMIASEGEPSGLKKAILEVIANNTAKTRVHLTEYLKSTFWFACTSAEDQEIFLKAIAKTLRYLVIEKFIEELKPGVFRATRLGIAVLTSGLHPDESLELVHDLTRARQGFCLLNDLHIIYQVTPNDIAKTVESNNTHYGTIWHSLDSISQSVGQLVGIDEVVIARKCKGSHVLLEEEKERVYRRFWVALIINDLINEMPLNDICYKYGVGKAKVQQAQRAVAQYAGVISIFCHELGYDNIAALVTPLESRINFSCQRDLLDLIRLNVSRPIARSLFTAGYKSVITVAKADKLDIEFIIRQNKPFKKDASFTADLLPSIWVAELAKSMTTLDYASHIVETARSYVEIEFEVDPKLMKRNDEDLPEQVSNIAKNGEQPYKRGRLENDLGEHSEENPSDDSGIVESSDMVRANKDVPNFVVKYVSEDPRELEKFLEKWITQSSICLNFKLTQQVNNPIGAKLRGSHCRQNDENDFESRTPSQEGLALRLDIDNKKHIVTRLYACFDDDLTVYIINNYEGFKQIRDKLSDYLRKSYESTTAMTATQRKEDFVPTKLYTQNIVLTYKVLYAAFGLDQLVLNRHFEWHAFDVGWWMVNDCPTRGLNNSNSSLSLISTTKWALKYHHFLHTSSSRAKKNPEPSSSSVRSYKEFLRVKDIVKSGKTAILRPLINEIVNELRRRYQLEAYTKVEIPSRLAMAQMMIHGMGLNMRYMKEELTLYEDLSKQLTDIAQKYYAKSSLSLTNIKQVAHVIYVDLDLRKHLLEHSINTAVYKDATNSEILNVLSLYHPFPRLVQDFRKIGKALEALQSVNTHARYNSEIDMMRVFGECDFWQLTGRVAMIDPDLFTINRNFTVVLPAHGNREEETVDCSPRKCFVPSEGCIYVAADYSQLELRLLAHFSEDTNLLEILNRSLESDETYDVFKTVASKMYQKPADEVTSEDRQHAKQICYGIIYGMGNRSLASKLGVDLEKAEKFRQDFFVAFPRLLSYTDELISECERLGYVESLLHRRRILNGINSDEPSLKSKARRVAINTRIQSSASDIIKLAMQGMNRRIIEDFKCAARLVLEMHDELIYEVSPLVLDRFSKALKFVMEDSPEIQSLKVKLLVNLKKGTDWSNLESFNIDTSFIAPK